MALRETDPLGAVHVLRNTRTGGGVLPIFPIDNNITLGGPCQFITIMQFWKKHARILSFCSFNETKDEPLIF